MEVCSTLAYEDLAGIYNLSTETLDAKALAGVKVTGEIVEELKGPKIDILRYKNKTGYRRRQGFRSQLTRVKITAITK